MWNRIHIAMTLQKNVEARAVSSVKTCYTVSVLMPRICNIDFSS
jgi:hypothetical protein